MKKIKLKWREPIGYKRLDKIHSVTVVYEEDASHYDVLWSFINELVKNKFASEKEIREEFENLLRVIIE